MASERVEVQIVLDDGSIQKGFANIEKQAQKTFENFGGNFEGEVNDKIGSIILSIGTLGTAALALKKAFDLTFAGENIVAINKQFDILAEKQNISADAFRSALETSAKGLIDGEDLAKTATDALVSLGSAAQKLPEVLDLSRKASALLGTDFKETFDKIVNAIENGNVKALKNLNIFIDADLVYRKYAQTLGLVAGELTQAQRQQALLNAVLETGAKTFKNVEGNLSPLSTAFTRLKVSIGENMDSIALSFNKAFGAPLAKAIDFVNEKFLKVAPTDTASKIDELSQKLEFQKNKLKELNDELAKRQGNGFFEGLKNAFTSGMGSTTVVQNLANEYKNSVAKIQTELDKLTAARKSELDSQKTTAAQSVAVENKLTADQIQAINNRKAQVANFVLQQQQSELANKEQLLKFETDFQTRKNATQAIFAEKIKLLEQDTANKLLEVNRQYSNQAGFNDSQRELIRTAIAQDGESKRVLLSKEANEALTQQAEKTRARLTEIQSAVNGVIAGGAVALGESLSSAGNAFENFGKSIMGIIADQVIKLGQALIIQGLAIETFVAAINTLLPGSGLAAAAAGLGLVLFGTALKAAVGGGSSKSGSTSTAGGGADTGGGVNGGSTSVSPGSPVADIVDNKPKEPTTKIELNIQGDVLDSDQTGLRIVDLLNSAFDKNGVVVNGAV